METRDNAGDFHADGDYQCQQHGGGGENGRGKSKIHGSKKH